MKRLLIVEDEPFEAQELRTILEARYQDCKVLHAASASKALELIDRERPSAAILDIMLTGSASGLDVAKYIYEHQLGIPVVILSAFEEFEFAQAAIRYGIAKYLLKPARPEEILAALDSIFDTKTRAEAPGQTVWPYIQAGLVEDLKQMLHQPPGCIAVASSQSLAGCPQQDLLPLLNQYGWAEQYQGFTLFFLNRPYTEELGQWFVTLAELLQPTERAGLFFGASGTGNSHARLSLSLNRAIRAYLENDLNATHQLVQLYDGRTDFPAHDYPYELESDFLRGVERQDLHGCDAALWALLTAIVRGYGLSFQSYLQWIHRLHYAISRRISGQQLPQEELSPFDPVTPREIHRQVTAFLAEQFRQGEYHVRHPTVLKAIEGINAHYDQKVCLQTVAEALHISPVYLSRLFKQETGQTFRDYRTQVRIDAAKKMLADPSNSIAEISERCGYNTPGHFSEAFKTATGLKPSEYRKNRALGHQEQENQP